MARGLQFWVKGWSGSITVTDGVDSVVVTPDNSSSPFEVLKTVAANCQTTFGGTWSAELTSDFFEAFKQWRRHLGCFIDRNL